MNLLLLLVTIAISFVVVRAGAIAFELTGLERSIARFQALSCFSGTGFTTRESESIVSHPQRRRIATVLIILGNAGLVTMIATFANSLRPNLILTELFSRFIPPFIPALLVPWLNLAFIALACFLLFKLFTTGGFVTWLRQTLYARLIALRLFKPTHIQETPLTDEGFGAAHVHVPANSRLAAASLQELGLQQPNVQPLMILREGQKIFDLNPRTRLLANDQFLCFGHLQEIRSLLALSQDSTATS